MKPITALIASLTLLLFGCATQNTSLEGTYTLTELTAHKAPENASVTMTVTPDRIGGKGPINNWNGPLTNGKIGMIISTKKAGPPELMKMENAFFQAIDGTSLELDGDMLHLVRDGTMVAVFQRTE